MTTFSEWKRSLLIFISKIVVLAVIVGLAYSYIVPSVKQTWYNVKELVGDVKELIDNTTALARYLKEEPEGSGESIGKEFIGDIKELVGDAAALARYLRKESEGANDIDFSEFLRDVYILTERLKQDSDIMRLYVLGYSEDKIRGMSTKEIEAEEKKANLLTASPSMELFRLHNAIRNELNIMNKSMLTMSYSMGNTMGRMGSWMP